MFEEDTGFYMRNIDEDEESHEYEVMEQAGQKTGGG